jgi:hypothetical protein
MEGERERAARRPYLAGVVGFGMGVGAPEGAAEPAAAFGARDCSEARMAGVMSSAGTE